ncbi:hypothetical protein C8R43DRAFT_1177574 [Mycena crocata]|nr:hypothetical protein C8R43DRAFT_1177574 [Mycena crocata]
MGIRWRYTCTVLLCLFCLGHAGPSTNHTITADGSAVVYEGWFDGDCQSEPECFAQTNDDVRYPDKPSKANSKPGFAVYIFLFPQGLCDLFIDGDRVATVRVRPDDAGRDNLVYSATDVPTESHTLRISPYDGIEFYKVIFTSLSVEDIEEV